MRGACWLGVFAALVALAPGARSQEADVGELLARVREATASVETLRADLVQDYRSGDRKGQIRTELRLMKPNFGRARLKSQKGPVTVPKGETVSTGTYVYAVDHDAREFERRVAGEDGTGVLLNAGPPQLMDAVVDGFFQPDLIEAALAGPDGEIRSYGSRRVRGTRYEVLHVRYASTLGTQALCFVSPRGLLEGVEMFRADGAVSVWLRNVKLNVRMSPEEFEYGPPEGYRSLTLLE